MRMGATTKTIILANPRGIIALRNENGSYNDSLKAVPYGYIIALRNENGSYNTPLV